MKEPSNDQQKRFLDLVAQGEMTVAKAAELAGYSDASYGYALMKDYKEWLLDRVLAKLVLAAPAAAQTLINGIFEEDAAKLMTMGYKKDFAKEILDRAGVVKRDKLEVSVSTSQGVLLLPAKEKEGKAANE